MTPRFQADADFNQRIVLGLRRKEPAIDFRDARGGGVIGVADSMVLRIAAESGRWRLDSKGLVSLRWPREPRLLSILWMGVHSGNHTNCSGRKTTEGRGRRS